MKNKKPFRIGLCMAGAVSAGAYTAGVMDYLLEALAEWEQRKNDPETKTKVPQHQVVIPVMGGASAGGMTAMLTTTVLNAQLVPVRLGPSNARPQKINNKLYESWVNLIADDMFPKLLDNSDIKPGKVESMLNSDFIDAVADKMICCPNDQSWLPAPAYIETPLKLFTTLSNLEGFKYNTDFNSANASEKYNMAVHNDYACFELFDDSMHQKAHTKGWMPLNFQDGSYVNTAKAAAMATGAFPVGLKARLLHRNASDINDIPFLSSVFANTPIPDGVVTTLNIDGGMINNEPFDKVREVLDKITLDQFDDKPLTIAEKQNLLNEINCLYSNFENTVIMIDPFPSTEADKFNFSQAIPNVIGKTLSAMLSQMRAKTVTYRSTMVSGDASQYIITPSRKIPDGNGDMIPLYGEKAIACGTLGGFGGFLNKEFREHDYYLGRYNCEVFLRDYFTIPEEDIAINPIFADGYRDIDLDPYRASDPSQIQIIPIFTERRKKGDFPMPIFKSKTNWPTITEEDIDRFRHPIRNRIQKILLNIANWNCFVKSLLFLVSQFGLNRLIGNKVLTVIKDSLFESKLISDYIPESKGSAINRFKRSHYWKNWLVALVVTLLIVGVFRFTDFHVPGLISAEFANTPEIFYERLRPIIDTQPETIRHNLYLDFAFILAYSMLFYYSGKLMNVIGWLTGKRVLLLCFAPGLLDIAENLMFFKLLRHFDEHSDYTYFNLFHYTVVIKWILAGLGSMLVLIVVGKKLFAKEE